MAAGGDDQVVGGDLAAGIQRQARHLFAQQDFARQAAVAQLTQALAPAQTRQALRYLSDEQLRDIGLSRAQARTEVERPFWTLW